MEEPEFSDSADGSIKWYNHFGKEFADFSEVGVFVSLLIALTKYSGKDNLGWGYFNFQFQVTVCHYREVPAARARQLFTSYPCKQARPSNGLCLLSASFLHAVLDLGNGATLSEQVFLM